MRCGSASAAAGRSEREAGCAWNGVHLLPSFQKMELLLLGFPSLQGSPPIVGTKQTVKSVVTTSEADKRCAKTKAIAVDARWGLRKNQYFSDEMNSSSLADQS
ncbi:hypothetical protein MRX96_036693 [Rhipicephalus microplus]